MDNSIRSLREKFFYSEKKVKPKHFVIRTYGGGSYNKDRLVLELDFSYEAWSDGVGRLRIGDKEVYFDLNELMSYLRTSVK